MTQPSACDVPNVPGPHRGTPLPGRFFPRDAGDSIFATGVPIPFFSVSDDPAGALKIPEAQAIPDVRRDLPHGTKPARLHPAADNASSTTDRTAQLVAFLCLRYQQRRLRFHRLGRELPLPQRGCLSKAVILLFPQLFFTALPALHYRNGLSMTTNSCEYDANIIRIRCEYYTNMMRILYEYDANIIRI